MVYIRLLLETNQFLLVTSVYQIRRGLTTYSASSLVSLAVAFFVLAGCVKLMLVVGYLAATNYCERSKTAGLVFCELYNGKKNNLLARWYTFSQMLRRTLVVTVLMFGYRLALYTKLGIFLTVQLAYCAFIIIGRSQEERKDNISEIINEVQLLQLVGFLFAFNSASSWTDAASAAFINSILA